MVLLFHEFLWLGVAVCCCCWVFLGGRVKGEGVFIFSLWFDGYTTVLLDYLFVSVFGVK